ncbi:MAG: PIN domain-containing protein [Thaumarchaeota archaeon]|nr:PIN domain-containing protein [Nitrososphaerota archaeon]
MNQQTIQITLDTCVVIDLFEKRNAAGKLRAQLRGKSASIVLCDIVLEEVKRVRGIKPATTVSRISKLLKRKVTVLTVNQSERNLASATTAQYQFCHNGDNLILAFCSTRSIILITFDRKFLSACDVVGVAAFHPSRASSI